MMATPHIPAKVLPVGGFMIIPEIAPEQVLGDLESYFRGKVVVSRGFSVQEYTHYYDQEMGEDIVKYFYYVRNLLDVEGAEQWKIWSNHREAAYRAADSRRVNLDPGYLTLSKLVLFSTKGYAHRIYIRESIYAEVTLQYRHKNFHSLPWTYRDYSSPAGLTFWHQAREELERLLKSHSDTLKD